MGALEDLKKQLKARSRELEPLVAEYNDIQEALEVLDRGASVRKTSRRTARVASYTPTRRGRASKRHRAGRALGDFISRISRMAEPFRSRWLRPFSSGSAG
jgi:hypothetical protein